MPAELGPFETIEGDGRAAPATQHDIWVWTHGTGEDVELDVARGIAAALAPVATLAAEQPCFVYRDSRDLTGFIDGTENPPVEEAHDVALIPDGEPGEGGALVIAQRWVHDLAAFHAQRRRGAGSHHRPHQARQHRARRQARHRAHQPRGDRGRRRGARDLPPQHAVRARRGARALLPRLQRRPSAASPRCSHRMFGTSGDGLHDHLTDFTTPVSGSFYFAPSLDALDGILPSD